MTTIPCFIAIHKDCEPALADVWPRRTFARASILMKSNPDEWRVVPCKLVVEDGKDADDH